MPVPAKRADSIACAVVAAAILFVLFVTYRSRVWISPDSLDYLSLGIHRPIGYGAFLRALQALGMGQDLRFLPQVQGAMLVAALGFFAWAVGRALNSMVAALAVLVLPWLIPAFAEAVPAVNTEAPFMAAILLAAALCLLPCAGRTAVLLGIGACLGAAVLLRTTGWAVAVVPFLLLGARVRMRGLALVLAPLLGLWLLGTAVQAQLAGRVELSSFGVVSLMGKGALLADADDSLPEPLRELPEAAAEARALIADAPRYGLRARLRFQAYEDLRWNWIWPRAEAVWPGWKVEDRTSWAARIGPLAVALVEAHPLAYARLVAEDYLALFLWPELALPGSLAEDRAFLAGRPRRLIAALCDLATSAGCWPVLPREPAIPLWALLLPLSVLALAVSLAVLARGAAAMFGSAAPPGAVALLASLMLQTQAVVTAAAEAGQLRYAAPLVPFVVALSAATCLGAARRIAASAPAGLSGSAWLRTALRR